MRNFCVADSADQSDMQSCTFCDILTGQAHNEPTDHLTNRPRAAFDSFYQLGGPAGCIILASPDKPERASFSVLTSESWAPASPTKSFTTASSMLSSRSLSFDDKITADDSLCSGRNAKDKKKSWQKEGMGSIRRSSMLLTDRQRCILSLFKGNRVEDGGLLCY